MTRVTVTVEGTGELDVFMGKHLVAQVSAGSAVHHEFAAVPAGRHKVTLVLRTATDVRVRELIFG